MLSRFTEQVSERGDAAQGFGQVVAGRVGELPQVLIGAAQFGVGSFQVGRVRGDHGVGGSPRSLTCSVKRDSIRAPKLRSQTGPRHQLTHAVPGGMRALFLCGSPTRR